MNAVIHHAEDRGQGDYGWLQTRYSFSFADWYEPTRMGFGALRVLNDDTIAPASGFPMHGHRDMEIITVVTSGALTHKDSLGHTGVVRAGEVQTMSAGTGVMHSEYNASDTDALTLFQIWIETGKPGAEPRYAQRAFAEQAEGMELLAGPEGTGALVIGQDAFISRVQLGAGEQSSYRPYRSGHGLYVFVMSGRVRVAGEWLSERDALGLEPVEETEIAADTTASVLLIEVPMR